MPVVEDEKLMQSACLFTERSLVLSLVRCAAQTSSRMCGGISVSQAEAINPELPNFDRVEHHDRNAQLEVLF